MNQSLFGEKLKPGKKHEQEWRPIPIGAILLAVDPSSTATGVALLNNCRPGPKRIWSGVLRPRDTTAEMNKYDDLAMQLDALLANPYRDGDGKLWKITHACIETSRGGGVGGMSMIRYARAIGVCEAVCYLRGLPCARIGVTAWKGRTKKEETKMMVKAIFGYTPRDDNDADSCLLGEWLCNRREIL